MRRWPSPPPSCRRMARSARPYREQSQSGDRRRAISDAAQPPEQASMTNREIVASAFEKWKAGPAYISEIFAEDMRWTIVGQSLASRTYAGKQAFIDEVLHPFAKRFSSPFRPTGIRGVYADGDMVIV